tara:strand:+ start:1139 stop:1423 length:285 start_codon:yes stop_codon:yes gene_type:complete
MTKKRILLTLPPKLEAKLRKYSLEKGLPMSSIASLALDDYLPKDKKSTKNLPYKERRPRWASCKKCDHTFEPTKDPTCPQCGSSLFQVIAYYAD